MLTILIFSLVFAHNNLSRKDPRDYKCHVENASEIPGSARSLNIFLQAPGKSATKLKLSGTHKVITLECLTLQRPVQVNLLCLEKTRGDLTNQTAEKCTLQSLKAVASAGRKPVGHTCVILTHRRTRFQRKFILQQKVFLAGISNCVITTKLPKLKVFAEGLTVPHVHQENQALEKGIPSTNDNDMLNRLKLRIILKVLIACILLGFAILCNVFPCPCLCPARRINSVRSSRSSLSAACVPVHDQKETLLTRFLKGTEQKPLEASA